MVDALVLGTNALGVQVQVLSPAPKIRKLCFRIFASVPCGGYNFTKGGICKVRLHIAFYSYIFLFAVTNACNI